MENIIEQIFAMFKDGFKNGEISKKLDVPLNIVNSVVKQDPVVLKKAVKEVLGKISISEVAKKYHMNMPALRLACSLVVPTILIKLNDEAKRILIDQIKDGMSFEDLSIRTGVPVWRLKRLYKPHLKYKVSPDKIIKRLIKGDPVIQIARDYSLSASKIMTIARVADPSLRNSRDILAMRIAYAKKLHSEGVSIVEVAKKVNAPFFTVSQWVSGHSEKAVDVSSLDDDTRNALVREYMAGRSQRSLAIEYNINQPSLKSFLTGMRKEKGLSGRQKNDKNLIKLIHTTVNIGADSYKLFRQAGSIKAISLELSLPITDTLKLMVPNDKEDYAKIEHGSICPLVNFPDGSFLDQIILDHINGKDDPTLKDHGISLGIIQRMVRDRFYNMRIWLIKNQYNNNRKINIPKPLIPK